MIALFTQDDIDFHGAIPSEQPHVEYGQTLTPATTGGKRRHRPCLGEGRIKNSPALRKIGDVRWQRSEKGDAHALARIIRHPPLPAVSRDTARPP